MSNINESFLAELSVLPNIGLEMEPVDGVRAVLIGVVAEGKIWVSYVMGRLKPLLDAVVKRFNIRNVVFCTIINPRLLEKLRNIVRVFELPVDQHGEATTCIEVEWVPTDT